MIALSETAAKKVADLRLEEGKPEWVDNSMMGAGFAIKNANAKSSCGCGQSHQF